MSHIRYPDPGLLEENGAITTTTQNYRSPVINSQKPKKANQARHINTADLIVIEEPPRGITLQNVLSLRPTKRYWRVLEQSGLASKQVNSYVLTFVSEKQLKQDETGVTTGSFASLDSHEDLEDEPRLHRGNAFSVAHKPEILFSKQIELQTTDLPRWKPCITINSRMFEAEDD